MSLFNFLNKKRVKNFLVFDVASGTIGGSSSTIDDKGLLTVISTQRELLPFHRSVSGKNIILSMNSTLRKVANLLLRKGMRIDEVHVILSSPWVMSESKLLKTKSEKSFILTSSYVDNILSDEQSKFSKENKQEDNNDLDNSPLVTIEKKVCDIKLNGYDVDYPINKKCVSADIPVFISQAHSKVITEVQNIIKSVFHVRRFYFHSSHLSLSLAVRELSAESEQDFVFINVHGEATDIISASRNHLIAISSIPIGTRTMLRRYAEKRNIGKHLALSEMSLLVSGALLKNENSPKLGVIDALHVGWSDSVIQELKKIYENRIFPSKFYVAGDMEMEKAFLSLVKNEVMSGVGIRADSVTVIGIEELCLSKNVYHEQTGTTDELLALLSYGVSRIIDSKK